MTTYCIWEARDATRNKARLLFDDEINVLSFNMEDCGRNFLTIVDEKDLGRLVHYVTAFLMDRAIMRGEIEVPEAKE